MNKYILYKLLDEAGYIPSEENLNLLCESSDFTIYQLLDEAGYIPSKENLEIINEGFIRTAANVATLGGASAVSHIKNKIDANRIGKLSNKTELSDNQREALQRSKDRLARLANDGRSKDVKSINNSARKIIDQRTKSVNTAKALVNDAEKVETANLSKQQQGN